jgi:DNA-binding HxlR family transcriptional regulator
LETFGDRWSLLVIRDLMFKKYHEFRKFLPAGEGLATNVLSDRLKQLESRGIIRKAIHPDDARRSVYSLTEKRIGSRAGAHRNDCLGSKT